VTDRPRGRRKRSGGPVKDRRPTDPPPATTADPRSRVADRADGEREHLDDPVHFMRDCALLIATMHRAASDRERGER
jgi:hypothetical protein